MYSLLEPCFVLHVSDFHLSDKKEELECAKKALDTLVTGLQKKHIRVDYLLHTGDVINSSDLYAAIAKENEFCRQYQNKDTSVFDSIAFSKSANEEDKAEFNKLLKCKIKKRFEIAADIIKDFTSKLNIPMGNVVICCGNHDAVREIAGAELNVKCVQAKDRNIYSICGQENTCSPAAELFEAFLDTLQTANSRKRCGNEDGKSVVSCRAGDLDFLILNTNWERPQSLKSGYYCVNCEQVCKAIKEKSGVDNSPETRKPIRNIIMAHKPIYEICETARLSFKRYIKTPFMADLQEYAGENGIYLCGDKHTRSIAGSFFHDIPHYIGGEPLTIQGSEANPVTVEYNLLEFRGEKRGMERKIHLESTKAMDWKFSLQPQDAVVDSLYGMSQKYLIHNVIEILGMNASHHTWENICQRYHQYSGKEKDPLWGNLEKLYSSVCKYRECGLIDKNVENNEIFTFVESRISEQIGKDRQSKGYGDTPNALNLMNIRGEYGSGKSTFLGFLYIHLLHQYSNGAVDFIPAYFNLENDEIFERIQDGMSYYHAVHSVFADFTRSIQKIAEQERQPICYIIDGIDEQDCWSFSSEDSIGRGILDVFSKYNNVYYLMAFGQYRLPRFKNTMPARIYSDQSDLVYFNPIDVQEADSDDSRFNNFVDSFFKILGTNNVNSRNDDSDTEPSKDILECCNMIRKFRKLTINLSFMYQNLHYLTAREGPGAEARLKYASNSVGATYKYYIDRQNEICLEKLQYGYVHYAPAMAFLFSYRGYTYEKFKRLSENIQLRNRHDIRLICENQNKIYDTFQFIKKHRDAREYLIAQHYNRELRYYAEHPAELIPEDSILNEYIVRNIAVIIRKLWTDRNKFVIVCEKLLERKELSNCVLSMLIYCLAHQRDMYEPICNQLQKRLFERGKNVLDELHRGEFAGDRWNVNDHDGSDQLKHFTALSLQHTMTIFANDPEFSICMLFMENASFCRYNRQYQMLYYGDLSIQGEERKNQLIPSKDVIYKGFDFHNCFKYLSVKLNSDADYPLREFDLLTLWDLFYSRLSFKNVSKETNLDAFFYREKTKEKSLLILKQFQSLLQKNLERGKFSISREGMVFLKAMCSHLSKEIQKREGSEDSDHLSDKKRIFVISDKTFQRIYEKQKTMLGECESDDRKLYVI